MRERVAQTRVKLPQEVKEPAVNRFDVGARRSSPTRSPASGRSLSETRKFAEDVIKPALEQVDGVASVDVQGRRRARGARRPRPREDRRAPPLGAGHHGRAASGEPHRPRRSLSTRATRDINVRTVGEFKNVDEIRNLIIATAADGSSVRLRRHRQRRGRLRGADDPHPRRTARRRSRSTSSSSRGTNTVAVADAVKAKLAELQKNVPAGHGAGADHRSVASSSRRTPTRWRSPSSSAGRWPSSSSSSSCSTSARRSSARSRCRRASSRRSS